MSHRLSSLVLALSALVVASEGSSNSAIAAEVPAKKEASTPVEGGSPTPAETGRAAIRAVQVQLKQAEEYLAVGEKDAALAKYEAALAKYGKTPARFIVQLHLGRFYYAGKVFDKAADHYSRAANDGGGSGDANPQADERAEALYGLGLSYIRLGQVDRSFPSFRQVTEIAASSQWANLAYFQIGEAHLSKGNYTQAMVSFGQVGGSLEESQIALLRFELGKPVALRIRDLDLLVAFGKPVTATITTSHGDREITTLQPLRTGGELYISNVSTTLGQPKANDGVLQCDGGDVITVTYNDAQTTDGSLNVPRSMTLKPVGEGRIAVTDGAYLDAISQVILDAGAGTLNLRVSDADQDTGDTIDKLEVEIMVERLPPPVDPTKATPADAAKPITTKPGASDALGDQPETWTEISRRTLTLVESTPARREVQALRAAGTDPSETVSEPAPVAKSSGLRSGVFTGVVPLASAAQPVAGAVIVELKDRVTVRYKDQRHLIGDAVDIRSAQALIVPGSKSSLQADGTQLNDANLKVKKDLLQAEASLRLGEVYRDMGLEPHAQRRFDEALASCRRAAAATGVFDRQLHEETLYNLWKVYLAKGDLPAAEQACHTLQQEFPDSEYIGDSLLALGRAAEIAGDIPRAVQLYQQVASLPRGAIQAPEALYRIGQAYESQVNYLQKGKVMVNTAARQQAINGYRRVFTTFPDSLFAGEALRKIGDWYIEDKNWNQAADFFSQILREHPDAGFIADVLFNLGVCQSERGEVKAAIATFSRLEREYPGYERMAKARGYRNTLEKRIPKAERAGSESSAEKPSVKDPAPVKPDAPAPGAAK